jgi:hypothetical protein
MYFEGPWGPRTLCEVHINEVGRLGAFAEETITERRRPIVQEKCWKCEESLSEVDDLFCHGCPRAYHYKCGTGFIDTAINKWYCGNKCPLNFKGLGSPKANRYAKTFATYNNTTTNSNNIPMTPPPTPSPALAVTKKRRSRTEEIPDILLSFEPDAVVKRRATFEKIEVATPTFTPTVFPPQPFTGSVKTTECLNDAELLARHAKYECVEKEMRILKPDLLKTLFNNNSNSN